MTNCPPLTIQHGNNVLCSSYISISLQVPCYSYGQKLSKLAILRIACNYILSLAQLAELDYSSDHSSLSFSQCVEQCTRTLQAEGRSKKRKVSLQKLLIHTKHTVHVHLLGEQQHSQQHSHVILTTLLTMCSLTD